MTTSDMVNQPQHYRSHPSGVECIQITENLSFNGGSAFKYVYRRNDKWNTIEDLRKAEYYLLRHIAGENPLWINYHAAHGHLRLVIRSEPDMVARAFYKGFLIDNPSVALRALRELIARLEAAGDGSQP